MNTMWKWHEYRWNSGLVGPRLLFLAGLLPVVAVMVVCPASADEVSSPPHGRISFDGGGLLIRGLKDNDWSRVSINTLALPGDTLWVDEGGASELEFSGGTFLRMADASKVELVSLTPSFQFRGWVGSFYIQRLVGAPGQCLMQTPACTVEVFADSAVRVDIVENGGVTVTVRWGSADVRTDNGGSVRVSQGYRVWVDPGLLPSDPVALDRNQSDDFDRWNADRAAVLANAVKTLPREVPVVTAIGAAELASNGTWVYIDNRPYWRPVIVDYVPFRYGYWNYVPVVGHVWVGAYPFCYVTEHYGRWRYVTTYGWVWTYDPVWSPAWAVTMSVGDRFLWAPCDFYARPVLVTDSVMFRVGDLSFSVAAVSWMPATYITTGCAVVYPATPVIVDVVRTVPVTEVNIWNIYVNINYPRRIPRPVYPVDTIRVRDYNPPRSIRGVPQTLLAESEAPSVRAQVLESRITRSAFQPVNRAGTATAVRGIGQLPRTAPLTADNRVSQSSRSVRLANNLSAASPAGGIDRRIRAQMAKGDYGEAGRAGNGVPAVRSLPVSGMNRAAAVPTERAESSTAADAREQAYANRTPQGGVASGGRASLLPHKNITSVPTLTNTTPHRPLVNVERVRGTAAESPSVSVPADTGNREAGPVAREVRTVRPETSVVPGNMDLTAPSRTPVRSPGIRQSESVQEFTPRVAVRDMEPASPLLPGRNRSSSGSGSGTVRPVTPPVRPPAGSDQPRSSDRGRSAAPSPRSFDLDLPAAASAPIVTREVRPEPVSRPTVQPMSSWRSMSGISDTANVRNAAPVRVPSFSPEVSRGISSLSTPRAEQPIHRSPAVGEISRPSEPVSAIPSHQFSPRIAPMASPAMPSVRGGSPGSFTRMR